MTKDSLRKIADFVPFGIMCGYVVVLLIGATAGEFVLRWQHYLGLVLLTVIGLLFFIKHQYGILALAGFLLLGLFGLVSVVPAITISTTLGWNDLSINILGFQPIFLLWLTVHFIISARYYDGIATKKYWNELKTR